MSDGGAERFRGEGDAQRRPNMIPQRFRPPSGNATRVVSTAVRLALQQKGLATALFAVIAIEASAAGAAIVFIKEYLESLLAPGASGSILVGAAVLLGIWLVRTAASFGTKVLRFNLARAVELRARVQALSHLMRLSVGFLENYSRAELIQRVSNDTSAVRECLTAIATSATASFRMLALFVVALLMDPTLTIVATAALPLAVPLLLWIGKRLVAEANRQRSAGVKLVDLLVELMNGIRTIKAYSGEERERAFHREACEEIYEFSGRRNAWQAAAVAVPEVSMGIGLTLIVIFGGVRLVDGALQWPELLGFLLAVMAIQSPLIALIQAQTQFRAQEPYAARYFELLELEPSVQDPVDPVAPAATAPAVAFDRVSYQVGEHVIIDDVSFRIEPGETVGVVGPTGAGKTTLLNLIARFVDPTDGQVLRDGVDQRRMRQADLHRGLALVAQDAFLFATDVADNIRYARPGAGLDEVRDAAAAAGILAEIDEMPEGFSTRIGLGGRPVSGGQAQRIALARALLRDASLFLLDEATNALDSETEIRVQGAIDRFLAERPRTTVIVAHRLSTLRSVDRILVMEGGRLVGLGPHEALLGECETYRRLIEGQNVASWAPQAF